MSSVSSSSTVNNTYVSTTSSNQAQISSKLSKYLSDTKKDSEDLIKLINQLYKEAKSNTSTIMGMSFSTTDTSTSSTDSSSSLTIKVTNTFTKSIEKFIKAYNALADDTNSYDDEGLKSLKKSMSKSIGRESSTLSDLGITVDDQGKLKVDEDKCNNAVSKGDLSKFINDNKERKGFFYEIRKIATNLKGDNTYYLSDNSKKIIQGVNNTINNLNNSNSSSQFDTYA